MSLIDIAKTHIRKSAFLAGFVSTLAIMAFGSWAARHGANAGHLVTVLGGSIGTLLAITGAIQIEGWKRGLDKKESIGNIISILDDSRVYFDFLSKKEFDENIKTHPQMNMLSDHLKSLEVWTENVMKLPTTSMLIVQHMVWINRLAKEFTLEANEILGTYEPLPIGERNLDIDRNNLVRAKNIARVILIPLQGAIRVIEKLDDI